MSDETNARWIVELGLRPDKMKINHPADRTPLEERSRLFNSLFSLTIADQLIDRKIDETSREEIRFEQLCSQQDDLTLVWSDDVSLTLVFAASLIHHGSYSSEDLLERYFNWWMNGYFCPTGLCFTPRIDIKKSIDLFGKRQLARSLAAELDFVNRSSSFSVRAASLIRLSPIAYFYRDHPKDKRLEIVNDCARRIFGNRVSIDLCSIYIECLVSSLGEAPSKQSIVELLESAEKIDCDQSQSIKNCLIEVSTILSNDESRIDSGIELCLKSLPDEEEHRPFFNPLDADRIIVLLVYLQLSGAIYNCLPSVCSNKKFYGEDLIDSMVQWIVYRSKIDLHSV